MRLVGLGLRLPKENPGFKGGSGIGEMRTVRSVIVSGRRGRRRRRRCRIKEFRSLYCICCGRLRAINSNC